MVYTPTVWLANDVITSAKLNKLEEGARDGTKISTTDIDMDKDWGAHGITNVGIIIGQGIQATLHKTKISDDVILSDPSERVGTTQMLVSVGIPMGYMESEFRLKFDLMESTGTWYTDNPSFCDVKINGVTVLSIVAKRNDWESKVVDLVEIYPGDVISLYARKGGYADAQVHIKNFQLCGATQERTILIGSSDHDFVFS